MRKKFLLFDVDRTLLDFRKSEELALKTTLLHHGFSYCKEIRERYEEINEYYWSEFEKGTIAKQEILFRRFDDLFSEYGFTGNTKEFDTYYRAELSKHYDVIDGAIELLKELRSENFQIYYLTNGTKEVQRPRLQKSGLDQLADGIFISEEIGFQKPQKAYFDVVFSKIPEFSREEAIMIGDSLASDILGGITAGIDTCWYRQEGTKKPSDLPITYEISDLKELKSIL